MPDAAPVDLRTVYQQLASIVPGLTIGMTDPVANGVILAEVERLRATVAEYADHQSWRCGHPDRYPHDPDCPCGLVGVLRELGLGPGADA